MWGIKGCMHHGLYDVMHCLAQRLIKNMSRPGTAEADMTLKITVSD